MPPVTDQMKLVNVVDHPSWTERVEAKMPLELLVVPVIRPVFGLSESPVGKLVALKVSALLCGSLAIIWKSTGEEARWDRLPGLVSEGLEVSPSSKVRN